MDETDPFGIYADEPTPADMSARAHFWLGHITGWMSAGFIAIAAVFLMGLGQ